jgi:hypothetical protein
VATYYAWSRIQYDAKVDETGVITEVFSVSPGEKVTAQKLGLSTEQFNGLLAKGVVRTSPLPKTMKHNESPRRAMIREAQAALEGAEAGIPVPEEEATSESE